MFGFFFAISGDSFTNPELVRYAEQLRRELVLVPGVGKVAIGGAIPQQINVDISLAKMAARGITLNQLAAILTRLNVVSSAGGDPRRQRIDPPSPHRGVSEYR